jgi:hypothetical protein
MKSRQKRMPAKKQKQQPNTLGSGANGTSIEDIIGIDMSDVLCSTIDMSTVTIPSYSGITTGPYTIGTGSNYSWTNDNYSITTSNTSTSNVNISSNGITMKEDTDIKLGERSLKDFMDRVEEHLAILKPAPELEDKWDQLKALRNQYEALKADILEKEKLMKILKD